MAKIRKKKMGIVKVKEKKMNKAKDKTDSTSENEDRWENDEILDLLAEHNAKEKKYKERKPEEYEKLKDLQNRLTETRKELKGIVSELETVFYNDGEDNPFNEETRRYEGGYNKKETRIKGIGYCWGAYNFLDRAIDNIEREYVPLKDSDKRWGMSSKMRDWYTAYAPDDKQGYDIRKDATFQDLYDCILNNESTNKCISEESLDTDVYETLVNMIGVLMGWDWKETHNWCREHECHG